MIFIYVFFLFLTCLIFVASITLINQTKQSAFFSSLLSAMDFIPESQVTLSYLLKFRELRDSYFTACSRVFQYHCKIWVAWLSMVKPTQLSGIRFLKLQQTKCYIITITVFFFKYFKILAKKNCKSCLGASLLPLLLPFMSWFCFHPATVQVPLLLSDSFGVVRLGSAAAPALTNYIFFFFVHYVFSQTKKLSVKHPLSNLTGKTSSFAHTLRGCRPCSYLT